MEMHQVRYFLEVCKTLNFTRAAERCDVAQPSLTKAIKKLEAEMGGEMFRRERSKTHLTDLGKLMKPHLESIYEASAAAKADAEGFKSLEKAELTLGIMCTIGPLPMIKFLSRLRENITNIELKLHEGTGEELIDSLLEGELEVALIGMPELPERLNAIPLYSERYVVTFAKGHRFESMNQVPLSELKGEDYLFRINCEFIEHHAHLGVGEISEVNVRHQSEREDWTQALVLNGMGCSIMPEFLPFLPGITTRPIVEPEVSRTISLVTVAGRHYSPTLAKLVRLVQRFEWS